MNILKKSVWLLVLAAIALAVLATFGTFSPIAAQTTTSERANNTPTASTGNASGGMIDCENIASQLGGVILPNPTGVCDVAVPMRGLEVTDNATGANISNLLVINPIFEFTPVSGTNTSGTGNSTEDGATSNQTTTTTTGTSQRQEGNATTSAAGQGIVYGFAEIGGPEDQLPSLMRMLSNSTWNVVAVHNHVTMESPKMMFVHAVGVSDIDTLTSEAKSILDGMAARQRTTTAGETARSEMRGESNQTVSS